MISVIFFLLYLHGAGISIVKYITDCAMVGLSLFGGPSRAAGWVRRETGCPVFVCL